MKIHSFSDVITNSSSMIFCSVKNKTEKAIKQIIEEVIKEFDCHAVNINVEPDYNYEGEEIPDQFTINFDYECGSLPCKMMSQKFKEILGENFIES